MKKVPFLLRMIQGSIGKKLVVKHYRYGVVLSRFPDMSRIAPSKKQTERRNLFKEAVSFAQSILADPHKKAAFQQTLPKGATVYQAAIKQYMKEAGKLKEPDQPAATGNHTLNKQPGLWRNLWQKKINCHPHLSVAAIRAARVVFCKGAACTFHHKRLPLTCFKTNSFP